MKKITYILLISIIFLSCQEDNNSVPEPSPLPEINTQNIYSVLEITNSPVATYNFISGSQNTNLQVNTSDSFSYTSDMTILDWISGNQLSHSIYLNYIESASIIGCIDIEIKTYNNSNLVNTENFQLGYLSFSPAEFCDNLVANNLFSKTINITAD